MGVLIGFLVKHFQVQAVIRREESEAGKIVAKAKEEARVIELQAKDQALEARQRAEADIERLKEIIFAVEDSSSFDISNPEGWSIFSFVGEIKPNFCAGENCLCICDMVYFDNVLIQIQVLGFHSKHTNLWRV